MKSRVARILIFTVMPVCLSGLEATPGVADQRVLEANLDVAKGHSGVVPTVKVKFYENINDWDATGLPVEFRLHLYAKVNSLARIMNYSIYFPDISNPNASIRAGVARWREPLPQIIRLDSIAASFPSNRLGAITTQAINLCRSRHSTHIGAITIPFKMKATLFLGVVPLTDQLDNLRAFKFDRELNAQVLCEGRPQQQQHQPGPRREVHFFIKDADLQITQVNRQCPRRILVRVILRGNMDGRAHYTLHRSNGPSERREMVVQWQGGDRYRGSFDHQFEVAQSRVVEVWVEHKDKRIAQRRINVDCSKPFEPKGIWVQ